jgi:hypothetical protein
MLPADLSPQQACTCFKTFEQCVTTIQVAQNVKLSFAELKTDDAAILLGMPSSSFAQ